MSIHLVVLPQRHETQFVPLAVLGYCLTRTGFFVPLEAVNLNLKTVQHSRTQKLQDVIVSILAGCSSIKQADLRVRPDAVLAEAWGRDQFAQQSTLADTLDAFTASSVNQLRQAMQVMYMQHGQVPHHDFPACSCWTQTSLGCQLHAVPKRARKATSAKRGTAMVVNSYASALPPIMKHYSP